MSDRSIKLQESLTELVTHSSYSRRQLAMSKSRHRRFHNTCMGKLCQVFKSW